MSGNMVGRVFNDRYQITELIGVGGMAEVYKALDRVLGRTVAVKVMLPQYASDQDFRQRFRQEAASAANLSSPFIVNVYDWGQDNGTYFIVMEFVRGVDLKTAIKERGPINQRKVAEIGAQVCQALSVAHGQDIIHRDIKPQNIMMQPDGNIKVMDFGIARAKNSLKSKTASVLGTAHYISPEQAQGKELSATSDIYSLGIVLYEAVTGKLPFDGPDSVSVATKQVNELPVPPHEIKPDIDPALEAIIMQAMEKDPSRRFLTANDMKQALNNYLTGRTSNIGNEPTRNMAGYAAGPAMAQGDQTEVMPPQGQGNGNSNRTGQGRTIKTESPKQARRREKKRKALIALGVIAAILAVIGIAYAITHTPRTGEIPDVTGQSVQQATTTLEAAGYTVGTQTQVFSDNIGSGSVVSTDPPAGTQADSGTRVNLNVSKGREQIEVPDLSGMTEDQARSALTRLGLTPNAGNTVASDTVDEGRVASQDPASGTRVDPGATVTYSLSSGPDEVTIPDVTGQSRSSATSTLQAAGFTVQIGQTVSSQSVSAGNVVSQSPAGGTRARSGSTITLTISSGPSQVQVPNVVGMTQSSATSSLENAGFRVSVTTDYSNSVARGTVISQSVTGSANSGSTITITVSQGPQSTGTSGSNSSSTGTNSGSGSGSSSSQQNQSGQSGTGGNSGSNSGSSSSSGSGSSGTSR